MILRSVELKNFGKFTEATFEFRRGQNLVVGPNEAGKTTLMEAIPAVLFGVRNKERFRPWGRQAACEAALVLEGGNRTVRIERDLLTDRTVLIESDDLYQEIYHFEGKVSPQGRSSERTEYLEQLQRLFGIAEEDVFRASLFFGQGSLEVSGPALAAKIKTLLSGFIEVDYDKVLGSLQEDYFEITRENPWGKDKTRDRRLDELNRRIGELEERWFAAQGSAKELEELSRRMGALEKSLEHDRSEYRKGEKYLAWVRKQWQLEEKEQTLRKDFTRVAQQSEKVKQLVGEKENLEKEMARTGLPRELPDDLPILLTESEEVRKDMVGLQKESAELRQQLLAHANPPWKLSAALSAVFMAVGGLLVWLLSGWRVASLTGAGLLTSIIWVFYLWRAGKERAERSRIKGQAQVLERRREEAQARLAALDERFERLGMSPSAVEIVRMQKNLVRFRELQAKLREVESALKVLERTEELSNEKDQLTRQLAVLDERLEKEKPLRPAHLLSPEELPEAEEKLAALGQSIEEREKELLDLARREAALQGESAHLQQIEEEGESLKALAEKLTARRSALATAYDLLAGSVNEFRSTYLARFSEEIGEHLQTTTNGRYEEVRLEDDFKLLLGLRGGWRPVEHFSRGTLDGVYLAVRLALTRHLARDRRLPLLLDDPLVNLDRLRLGETLKALERLSGEHQVILFSHSESLARRAARDRWHVISLEDTRRPAPVREAVEEGASQLCLL